MINKSLIETTIRKCNNKICTKARYVGSDDLSFKAGSLVSNQAGKPPKSHFATYDTIHRQGSKLNQGLINTESIYLHSKIVLTCAYVRSRTQQNQQIQLVTELKKQNYIRYTIKI